MSKITFIEHNGTERVITVDIGRSVMEAAVDNGVPGIDADCGGSCSCATCHVYVDAGWLDKLAPMGDLEAAMLDLSADCRTNSRLACQLEITDDLDGLIVTTPQFQY